MAFIASQLTLRQGFEQLLSIAGQQKVYLNNWNTRLAGNITALDAMEIVASVTNAVTAMSTYASLPGMAAYAQAQFGGSQYDVVAEFNAMRSALQAVANWLKTNIPANAITVSDGAAVGASYAPAATAPLKSLVVAAIATIA